MRVLVVGSGAREHAILLALAQDPGVTALACAPGNAGTASVAEQRGLDVVDPAAVAALALDWRADLVVVGPEAPLVAGVADAVRLAGVACFGPSAQAARIEGSKAFAKDVMAAAGVPTAGCEIVDNPAHLDAALDRFTAPYVVKDDGLAAGKGVVVTPDRELARAPAMTLLDSGHPVLLEAFLDGPEASLFCLVDGETVVPLLPAQDFKRVGDDDTGPNTGGMGAYAPLPWAPADLAGQLVELVVAPVAREMVARGTPFQGLLYAGLALTSAGPSVIEFNCRFGDPETQVVLPLLRTPLAGLLRATATGTLAEVPPLDWSDGAAVTVVVASQWDQLVTDHNVLLEFYAPWCGHCRSLAPTYEKVAQHFEDDDTVTIGKMDATANDVLHKDVKVEGFPTIVMFTNDGRAPTPFNGPRTKDGIVAFVYSQMGNTEL